MPSSHMAVMAAFCLLQVMRKSTSLGEKIFWVCVTILQGYSRMVLNYHTLEQVIAGSLYGAIYYLIFKQFWKIMVTPIIRNIEDNWFKVESSS